MKELVNLNPAEYEWFYRIQEYMVQHGLTEIQYLGLTIKKELK